MLCGRRAQEYQPERLSDSSRWSKRSGDHRLTSERQELPERVPEKQWHPAGVRYNNTLLSGGLRYASTTGYFRSNPPG